ncbi:hypothetical protein E1A91_A04G045200v1 [Gossypium mustelinum]|uniref:Uncharacterized protein n=1 Tax=Gossypium mustelinum TaxID=34275 RepID=A0A5D2ZM95_GOSMU|nr:hypothetical protein E1A91_A04G045200v1 [Gossypium mustelinum]
MITMFLDLGIKLPFFFHFCHLLLIFRFLVFFVVGYDLFFIFSSKLDFSTVMA